MKRVVPVWLLILCLTASVFACASGEASDSGNAGERYLMDYSCRDGVDEFLAIIGEIHGEGLLNRSDFSPETCWNVTSKRVAAETDIRIFRDSRTAASFALVDGEVCKICRWFGGHGFMDAFPWDVDEDGQTDLLIASSWGSGLHRAELSVFNRASKETTVIFDTTEGCDLCFSGMVVKNPYAGNGIVAVGVDRLQFVITEDEADPYRYEKVGPYGAVQLRAGVPVFCSTVQITGQWRLYTRTDCTETVDVLADGPRHCDVCYDFRGDGTYHYRCDAWFGKERNEDRTGTYAVCGNWLVLDGTEILYAVVSEDGLALDYPQYETLIDVFVPVT